MCSVLLSKLALSYSRVSLTPIPDKGAQQTVIVPRPPLPPCSSASPPNWRVMAGTTIGRLDMPNATLASRAPMKATHLGEQKNTIMFARATMMVADEQIRARTIRRCAHNHRTNRTGFPELNQEAIGSIKVQPLLNRSVPIGHFPFNPRPSAGSLHQPSVYRRMRLVHLACFKSHISLRSTLVRSLPVPLSSPKPPAAYPSIFLPPSLRPGFHNGSPNPLPHDITTDTHPSRLALDVTLAALTPKLADVTNPTFHLV